MSEKAVYARRQPWWRLVNLGHTPYGMTNIFSLATPLSSTKLCLPQPATDYLKKVLAIEGQNCGTASQMMYEIKNHFLPLKPVFVHLAKFLKLVNLFTYFM